MTTAKPKTRGGLANSLLGRKCRCAIAHLWFGRDGRPWDYDGKPLPTDEGTIVAAFTERDGGAVVIKVLVESETGELKGFYAEHVALVPLPNPLVEAVRYFIGIYDEHKKKGYPMPVTDNNIAAMRAALP